MTGPSESVTLRLATAADRAALERLAQLDSARRLAGEVLVAEVAHELRAALSLGDRRAVADPFRLTADLVVLLHGRADQLERARPARPHRAGLALRVRARSPFRRRSAASAT
jgi:hypothetical protein